MIQIANLQMMICQLILSIILIVLKRKKNYKNFRKKSIEAKSFYQKLSKTLQIFKLLLRNFKNPNETVKSLKKTKNQDYSKTGQ